VKPILEVRNLAKKYRLRHQTASYLSLRERLLGLLQFTTNSTEDFWALSDISFDVCAGESIGIIGQNGAGKSTLLKILSRITPPTKGKFVTRGRIASLLEVGTGFHPELTGRENIFFNGSLLGMKKREISAKLDEIVDFSGTEKFLDTPLKHYSSGMQLRLAFSVAAFLEPETLVIDEVLAVGDADFQKKCLGKMEDVSNSGRTILFVSHNLDAVEKLCRNSILLSKGKLVGTGPSSELINDYLSEATDLTFKKVKLTESVTLEVLSFSESVVLAGQKLGFQISVSKAKGTEFYMTDLCLLFYNYKKQRVGIFDLRNAFKSFKVEPDEISYMGEIHNFNLVEGTYYVGLFYGFNSQQGDLYDICKIQVKSETNIDHVRQYDVQYRGFVELK
jgi:lipopolysaccharide transport system ATP-binding protein